MAKTTNQDKQNQSFSKKRKQIKHSLIYAVVLLLIVITAVLLCVFVFFNVGNIEVAGSSIYSNNEIISSLSIKVGDNIVFADTEKIEEELVESYPYIDSVNVSKHLPSTINIEIQDAAVVYYLEHSGRYIYVSKIGKILEINESVPANAALLIGGEYEDVDGKLQFTDSNIDKVFDEIVSVFMTRDNTGINQIDISDIYNIKMTYNSRVELVLGSSADLVEKLNYGLQIIQNNAIGADERGILDLSLARDLNKAYFSEEIISSSSQSEETSSQGDIEEGETSQSSSQEGSSENQEESVEESSQSQENSEEATPSRGSDIPDF